MTPDEKTPDAVISEDALHIFQADDKDEGICLRSKMTPVDIEKLLRNANDDVPTGMIISIQKAIDFVSDKENGAAGLAAPQIGCWDSWFVMKVGRDQEVMVVLNPDIIGRDGRKQQREGCFSESHDAIVKRSRIITVNYTVLAQAQGEWYTSDVKLERLEGWDARVFQHEYDHLRGVLICEKKGAKVIHDD